MQEATCYQGPEAALQFQATLPHITQRLSSLLWHKMLISLSKRLINLSPEVPPGWNWIPLTPFLLLAMFVVVQSLSHVWLWPHGLQHARLPCSSPSPGVCLNSCPLSQWCHPTIWFSVTLCSQSFPASGSFPMSRFFTSGGQNIGTSASVCYIFACIFHGVLPILLAKSYVEFHSPVPMVQTVASGV